MTSEHKSQRKAQTEFLNYRNLAVRASTVNVDERSVDMLLATELPVEMFDWDRYEMVPEVLRTEGAQFPGGRQVPLLDNHNRRSTTDQLGSIRSLDKTDDGVVGRAFFSKTAEDQFTKVREGHITDVSVGYQVLERTYIPKGETQTVLGRQYSGPVSVVTNWRVREGSITPIGADEQAKLRGLESAPFSRKERQMTDELRTFMLAKGMPAELTDEAADKWVQDNFARTVDPITKDNPKPPATPAAPLSRADVQQLFDAGIEAKLEGERTRVAELRKEADAICDIAEIPQAERAAIYGQPNKEAIRKAVVDLKAEGAKQFNTPLGPRIEFGPAARDVRMAAMNTVLSMRALQGAGASEAKAEKLFPAAERSKEAKHFGNCSLLQIAEECLLAEGIPTRGLSREQIAKAALGFFTTKDGLPANVERAAFDAAYHVTGSFPKLTQDAMNKSMMVGYTEVPTTWDKVFRRGDSVPDFKTIHRIRLGAIPNLPVWVDNKDPENVSLADAEEKYAVEAYSAEIDFSWRVLMNDDMSVLSRVPSMFGAAAARTVNAGAWAQITSNPTMSADAQALFLETATGLRFRSNLTTGSATPTTATIQTMRGKMRLMRGENTPEGKESADILNLIPRYIVGPVALETIILQLVRSVYDPVADVFMVYNPTTVLQAVIEPLLDASSATAWYLFADPAQIDTVEVTFLQGQEQPVTRNWNDPSTLSQKYAVLQTFAAKPLNHRGLQKHNGV